MLAECLGNAEEEAERGEVLKMCGMGCMPTPLQGRASWGTFLLAGAAAAAAQDTQQFVTSRIEG